MSDIKEYKVSYIFTKNEMLFLVSCISNPNISNVAQYLLDKYLTNSIAYEDAIEGLIYKKLAKRSMGTIVIEPVIDFLVRTVLSTNKLWIIKSNKANKSVFIVKAHNLYLHIQSYPIIDGAWKLTPFNNLSEMKKGLINLSDYEVSIIDKSRRLSFIQSAHDLSWLEED